MQTIKRILKFPIASLLAMGARLVIAKYRPTIVMITGSVGKTSAKDAIGTALDPQFFLRKTEKSYNSEFGVPFTIIGVKNPWLNPFAWFVVFRDLLALLVLPNHYPNLLILEVGADRPGDIARILRIATPDTVVVTRLPDVPVHVEAYASPAAVREEEFLPAYSLGIGAPLIISADDPHARSLAESLPVRVITYGFAKDANVHAGTAKVFVENGVVAGMSAEVRVGEIHTTLIVRGVLGSQHLYAPLAALASTIALSSDLEAAVKDLASYVPPAGRERIFRGQNGSIIVDGSYNASPAAVECALDTLKALPQVTRRIAVLGDMLELGRYSVIEHERMGAKASACADLVVAVGVRAKAIARAALEAGMKEENVLWYDSAVSAAKALPSLLRAGDAVFVKGSQGVRLERIVKALLADPTDSKYLVRQEREWQRIA